MRPPPFELFLKSNLIPPSPIALLLLCLSDPSPFLGKCILFAKELLFFCVLFPVTKSLFDCIPSISVYSLKLYSVSTFPRSSNSILLLRLEYVPNLWSKSSSSNRAGPHSVSSRLVKSLPPYRSLSYLSRYMRYIIFLCSYANSQSISSSFLSKISVSSSSCSKFLFRNYGPLD